MNGLASSEPAVRVEGVVKRFGETVALDGAGLEVPAGMVFGLLGPNGAGKTTLVRILTTLLAPDAGRAEVLGHDVVREAGAVRDLIGLTGQFAAVDELLTGRENLEMFGRLFNMSREDAGRRAGELLERFDLAQAADRPARTYSGGMRRRLDIAFIRQPDLLTFSTIQPVLFVLLFVYVFGGAVSRSLPHGVAYVDFLLPGIFVQSVTFGASQTAVGLSEDLQRGVVDRFRSMPMARSAVLAGRTVADLVRNILIIFLMIAVGYLVGFRFHGGVAGAVGCIAVVAAFGFALSWIFAFVALTVRGAEAAQTAGFVVIFPLVFASSVFVPVSTFPDWLQAFAKINPVTVTANAARSLAFYGTPASLGAAAAWIGGLLAVFISLSVWRYRRIS
jgi:ABC-2 type transport system permease protein/oleandomycin transport system permease protein